MLPLVIDSSRLSELSVFQSSYLFFCYRIPFVCVNVFFFRWLDRNEDDGHIVRELVPAGDGLRLFSKGTFKKSGKPTKDNISCNDELH